MQSIPSRALDQPRLTVNDILPRLRGVRRCGNGYIAFCPGHDDHERSLSITERGDRLLINDFSKRCTFEQIISAIRGEPVHNSRKLSLVHPDRTDDKQRIAFAQRIWRECREPKGTAVERYLHVRGFSGELPSRELADGHARLAIPASLRFHPRLKHPTGLYLPAMVAAIENLEGQIVGIHRTFLKPDGTGKADVAPSKMILGCVKGCAVHLTAPAPELVLCEGIEDGLAILQATGRRVWATLSCSILAEVHLPTFVIDVIIAADNDGPGLKAARDAVARFKREGKRVQIVLPGGGLKDFNDRLVA
jgi:putative DNA primase/helicase